MGRLQLSSWLFLAMMLSMSVSAASFTKVFNYTDTSNNHGYWNATGGSTTWATGWGSTGELNSVNYTNMSKRDVLYGTISSTATNANPFGRFEFVAQQPVTNYDWLNFEFTGKKFLTSGAEVGTCYYANFTGSAWTSLGVLTTTNANYTNNFSTAQGVLNVLNTTGDYKMAIQCIGAAFDAGEIVQTDYVGVTGSYSIVPPIFYSNMTNNTNPATGDVVNFSVSINSTNENVSGYIFSWDTSGAGCNTYVNASFTSTVSAGKSVSASNSSSIPAACVGKTVHWLFYANNSQGWNNTGTQSLAVKAANTCTAPGTSNWAITGGDNCNIQTTQNLGGYNMTCSGAGMLTINASLINWGGWGSNLAGCNVLLGSNGKITKASA